MDNIKDERSIKCKSSFKVDLKCLDLKQFIRKQHKNILSKERPSKNHWAPINME